MQRLINLSDKPFRFQADGKEFVVPPKAAKEDALYHYLENVEYDTPHVMTIPGSDVKAPVLHPVTKEPVTRKAWKTEIRTSKRAIAGAKKDNFIMISDVAARELKAGSGPQWMARSGIRPAEIVFGQEAVDHLDREIQQREQDIVDLERRAEERRAQLIGPLEEERARLLEQIAREEARLDAARAATVAAPAAPPAKK